MNFNTMESLTHLLLLILFPQNSIGTYGGLGDKESMKFLSVGSELETSGTKCNAAGPVQTLEQCYSGVGRFLTTASWKKKLKKMEQECCCVCCGRKLTDASSKSLADLGNGPIKCCSHVEAGGGIELPKPCSNEEAVKMIENSLENAELSLQRSVVTGSASAKGHAPNSDRGVVSGTVQRNDGRRSNRRKRAGHRSTKTSRDGEAACICQICCEICCPRACYNCCGDCLLLSFGGLVWSIDRGCRAFCGLIGKALTCCC